MTLDTNWLIASYLWGTVGFAFCVYGRKSGQLMPLVGGVVMMVASFLIPSVVWLTVACVLAIVAVRFFSRLGY